ncbi:MAG: STAS domain-containing protein [Spirochaetes bacterium]|nr:STAS domain-containing protein [Spirochaetota bacterium]
MPRELTLSMRSKYGYDIVDIGGDITYDDFPKIDAFVKNSITPGFKNIIFNMEAVKYINSSALSLLIKLMHEFSIKKIDMYIMHASEEIEGLMKMTGVKKYFMFIKDEQALMKKLQREETDRLLKLDD